MLEYKYQSYTIIAYPLLQFPCGSSPSARGFFLLCYIFRSFINPFHKHRMIDMKYWPRGNYNSISKWIYTLFNACSQIGIGYVHTMFSQNCNSFFNSDYYNHSRHTYLLTFLKSLNYLSCHSYNFYFFDKVACSINRRICWVNCF